MYIIGVTPYNRENFVGQPPKKCITLVRAVDVHGINYGSYFEWNIRILKGSFHLDLPHFCSNFFRSSNESFELVEC